MTSTFTFRLTSKVKAITIPELDHVHDHYLYELLDNGVVFYVGYGVGRKAWNYHNKEVESTRLFSREYRVRIVCDRLTKDLASLRKKALIDQHRSEGIELLNIR